MKQYLKPSSVKELSVIVPVVKSFKEIKNGYLLDYSVKGGLELRRYENTKFVVKESIYIGLLIYENFASFMEEMQKYIGRKKLYISYDYAIVLLAIINGGDPEDYV